MTTAKQILNLAKKQIGNRRTKYVKAYGVDTDWCVIFIWWLFKELNSSSLFYDGKKTAYVPAVDDWAVRNKLTVSKKNAKAGDLVIFDWYGDRTRDHIGIIEKVNSNGTITTIEGNTTTKTGKVDRKTRLMSDVYHVIRPKYAKPIEKLVKGNYRTLYNMCVRTGAGTNYRVKYVKELTKDGQKKATSKNPKAKAKYKKGIVFTASKIINNTGVYWGKTPSGYVCLKGKLITYCKKI